MNAVQLMVLPFLECLVLVGIHSYLGIHVIKREVIFVDLSLAQIAALGTTVAYLFGIHPHSTGSYCFSLVFTFLAAAVFSLTRLRRGRVPQEAVIGLVYALAAATAILVIDRSPHGAEHIKEILTGSILWVRRRTVTTAAVVYAFVGLFHYVFRKRFLLISEDVESAYRMGIRVRLWDFFFYMSFGLVITHSVETAGVLLVFVFLVVPAVLAILLTDRLLYQLIIGWTMGTLVSFAGLALSYFLDLPTGPAVVSFYGLVLLFAALLLYLRRSPSKTLALKHIVVGLIAMGFFLVLLNISGKWIARHPSLAHPEWKRHARSHEQASTHRSVSLAERIKGVDLMTKKEWLSRLSPETVERDVLPAAYGDPEMELAVGLRLLEVDPCKGEEVLEHLLRRQDIPPLHRAEALRAKEKQ